MPAGPPRHGLREEQGQGPRLPKDPIELVRKGNFLMANGTTLGADNGIAVATNLAIMEDKTLVHGPLEFLFTIDEETGLTGADGPRRRLRREPDADEPRLRGGGRAVRRLLRRPRHRRRPGSRSPTPPRRGASSRRSSRCRASRAATPGLEIDTGPRQRDQDPEPRPAGARRARRPALVHRGRQQAQRHPARGGGRCVFLPAEGSGPAAVQAVAGLQHDWRRPRSPRWTRTSRS